MPPPEQQIAHASAGSWASASFFSCPVVSVICPPKPPSDQPRNHDREQADYHTNCSSRFPAISWLHQEMQIFPVAGVANCLPNGRGNAWQAGTEVRPHTP